MEYPDSVVEMSIICAGWDVVFSLPGKDCLEHGWQQAYGSFNQACHLWGLKTGRKGMKQTKMVWTYQFLKGNIRRGGRDGLDAGTPGCSRSLPPAFPTRADGSSLNQAAFLIPKASSAGRNMLSQKGSMLRQTERVEANTGTGEKAHAFPEKCVKKKHLKMLIWLRSSHRNLGGSW